MKFLEYKEKWFVLDESKDDFQLHKLHTVARMNLNWE
jgi:hypothetical protein